MIFSVANGDHILLSEQKEWNFEGTKQELLTNFYCLNAYDQQFYVQIKEVNDCLVFRTLMFGFQEEVIPFEVSIEFFLENGKRFKIEDYVYPIIEEKDTIFKTSMHCNLERLTRYYDAETREFKNQPKIRFTMEIISPKLDEVAKDQRYESGM